MRSELDTDFCNFLNFAIEQEENRLQAAGIEPAVTSKFKSANKLIGGAVDASDSAVPAGGGGAMAVRNDGMEGGAQEGVPKQQWLLVLQLVRQGTYAMLAKEYDSDVKQIRYIIGLASPEARRELATRCAHQKGCA